MTEPNDDRPRSFFTRIRSLGAEPSEAEDKRIAKLSSEDLRNMPHFPRPQRVRSKRVADAEAEWEQLEQDLAYERQNVEALRAENAIFKQANTVIREEMRLLKLENERLVRENSKVVERVRCAAELLINLQKPVLAETSSFDASSTVHSETGRITTPPNEKPNVTEVTPSNWPKPPKKENQL